MNLYTIARVCVCVESGRRRWLGCRRCQQFLSPQKIKTIARQFEALVSRSVSAGPTTLRRSVSSSGSKETLVT